MNKMNKNRLNKASGKIEASIATVVRYSGAIERKAMTDSPTSGSRALRLY